MNENLKYLPDDRLKKRTLGKQPSYAEI